MSEKQTPPKPIIDNLSNIGNPFKQRRFPTPPDLTNISNTQVETDLEYALKFLYSYNGSTGTFNSYRRDLERLLQWSWRIEKTSVLDIKREHIEDFFNFCLNPPKAWIGTKNVARFKNTDGTRKPNPDWRPFVATISKTEHNENKVVDKNKYHPSKALIKGTFTALSSFYEYLIQEELIESNPVALIKQKSKFIQKNQHKSIIRRISSLQWDYVLETVEMMASEKPNTHERTLFIMNCLFAMYLRISEIVEDERSTPVMSHFKKDQDNNWWFDVTGKGNKNRSITVCDDMLEALKRYRKHLGLSELPSLSEQYPLVATKAGKAITSTRQIRTIVQRCFDATYARMCEDGLKADAIELKTATVHWLRHTGISEDVKFRPREHVRDDAGHSSMATTDGYVDSIRRERHQSGRSKRVRVLT